MRNTALAVAPAFLAQTGAPAYDEIRFSGPPLAERIGASSGRISAVRHLGLPGDGIAHSSARHDDADLLILNLSTGGEFQMREDGRTRTGPLRRGYTGFSPCGMDINLSFPASNSALILMFGGGVLREAAAPLGEPRFDRMASASNPRLAQLSGILESELRTRSFASDLIIDGVVSAIAAMLSRHDCEAIAREAERIHITPVRLARVLDYVETRLGDPITLSALAAVAQLSPFHFSRVFKRQMGETPYQYVSARRIDRAARLLREGEIALADLALACGFSSQAHFTAAFTKALGVPPGRYRRRLRGSDPS